MGSLPADDYFAGLDIGSTMTKVVILGGAKEFSLVGPTGPEHRKLANRVMEQALELARIKLDQVAYIVATGYGRINVPFADRQVTEITCHAKGLAHIFPNVKTVIDVGGQDIKAIRMENGRVVDFVMNDKCASGTGRFLEIMADALGVSLDELGKLSLAAHKPAVISNTCTVFAEQEIISRLAEGEALPNLIAGIHDAVAARIYALASKLKIEREVVLTGGGAKNPGLVRALESRFGFPLLIPPDPLITGALGAALMGRQAYQEAVLAGRAIARKPRELKEASLFEGLEQARC